MAILLLLASSSYTRVYGTDMGAVITGTVFGVIGPYCTSRKARGHNVDHDKIRTGMHLVGSVEGV